MKFQKDPLKQLKISTIFQASLPLIIICIPTVIVVMLALTYTDVPQAGAVAIAFLCWLSVVKPMATILVVPRYREFVRNKMFGLKNAIHSSSLTQTTNGKESTIGNEDEFY